MKLFKISPAGYDANITKTFIASEDIQTAIEKWRDERADDHNRAWATADVGTIVYIGEVVV